MIEVIIERWTARDGRVDFISSLWRDGKREAISQPHTSSEAAESDGVEMCHRLLGCQPDRITRL
ncbi:MAG TPA: hypothetical protein VEJ16_17045 [Alphaproteobacteria bacterium]|nr:hypothetical protein [Alphaproteobacteria bacterium]